MSGDYGLVAIKAGGAAAARKLHSLVDKDESAGKGLGQGYLKEDQSLLLMLLERRFGKVDLETSTQIHLLSLEQVQALKKALLGFYDCPNF